MRTDTKKEAVKKTTQVAKAADGQIIVHGKDGKIQYEHTYGHDPESRKS